MAKETVTKSKDIIIKGAKLHNLKNIDVTIPRNKLVVITGLSGSGKSSLAFDTLYAEGQRRYVESLSSYARQFLGRLNKPKVDSIKGLSRIRVVNSFCAGYGICGFRTHLALYFHTLVKTIPGIL